MILLRSASSRGGWTLLRLALPAAVFLALHLPAAAAIIVVDSPTGVEPGTCSLAEAIDNANDGAATHADCAPGDPGADTIQLALDVLLLGPLPDVTSEIVLQGNGFGVERFSGLATLFSVFRVVVGGDLSLQDTTVRGGDATLGGGIYNAGTVSLSQTTVSSNSADEGGGIYNIGTLSLGDSVVSENQAGEGGGIRNALTGTGSLVASTVSDNVATSTTFAGQGGGIYNSEGTLTLEGSTVSGNIASGGSFAFGGGIYNASGIVNLLDSAVSDNRCDATSGALGAGLHIEGGTVYAERSTIAGNLTVNAGALLGGGFHIADGGNAYLDNATVSGNLSTGIYVAEFGFVDLENSTLFGNQHFSSGSGNLYYLGSAVLKETLLGGASNGNCGTGTTGVLDNQGGNLADDTSCGTIPGTLLGVDPTLADNGGPTKTHALLPGSNAIDHAGACGLTVDQRGNPRDDGACDAGAFELDCYAPHGAYLLLEMGTAAGERYEACWQIAARNGYSVPPGGLLTLRSGRQVLLGDDFRVDGGGTLTVDIDPSLQMPPRPKVVFVSSVGYTGNLGGLAGADGLCNQLAAAAGRSGSYKAWLSDLSCTVADACRGFTQATVPYIRPDGVRVADDWADLVDGALQAPISVDELGGSQSGVVATGTAPDGGLHSAGTTCGNWTSASSPPASGGAGSATRVDSGWTDSQTTFCSAPNLLYCFEQ